MIFKQLSFWLAIIGLASLLYTVKEAGKQKPMPKPPIDPVENMSLTISAPGMIEAFGKNTDIGSPQNGIVKEVYVRIWDKVKAGDKLYSLDDRELQAQLKRQESDLLVEQAHLDKIKKRHQRAQLLLKKEAVSQQEAELIESDLNIQEAQILSANTLIQQTKVLIERLTVIAPIDGTILQVNILKGENTSSSNTSSIVLGNIDDLQVLIDIDEQLIPQIAAGKKATGFVKGNKNISIPLEFVNIEPYVLPKKNLTGAGGERTDTRVLQIIYKFKNEPSLKVYVGQQMDILIEK
jgi:HlyD family secretion protein